MPLPIINPGRAISHAALATALLAMFMFLGHLGPGPLIAGVPALPAPRALLINNALALVFCTQHAHWSCPAYRRWWLLRSPPAMRPYLETWMAALITGLLILGWQPISRLVWRVDGVALEATLKGGALLGLGLLLARSHDLLRAVTRAVPGTSDRGLLCGWLLMLWCTPIMTLAHLQLAILITFSMLCGCCLRSRQS